MENAYQSNISSWRNVRTFDGRRDPDIETNIVHGTTLSDTGPKQTLAATKTICDEEQEASTCDLYAYQQVVKVAWTAFQLTILTTP